MSAKHDWTDRRRWNNAILLFTAGIVLYAVVYHPLAGADTLIAGVVEALITASVFVITGYTLGRVAQRHNALRMTNADLNHQNDSDTPDDGDRAGSARRSQMAVQPDSDPKHRGDRFDGRKG